MNSMDTLIALRRAEQGPAGVRKFIAAAGLIGHAAGLKEGDPAKEWIIYLVSEVGIRAEEIRELIEAFKVDDARRVK